LTELKARTRALEIVVLDAMAACRVFLLDQSDNPGRRLSTGLNEHCSQVLKKRITISKITERPCGRIFVVVAVNQTMTATSNAENEGEEF
jgi:hypothetical protein